MSQNTPTRLVQRLKRGRKGDPIELPFSTQGSPQSAPEISTQGVGAGHTDCACHPSAQELLGGAGLAAATGNVTPEALAQGQRNLKILGIVVVLNLLTMLAELVTGFLTHSVSLTADGWHMAGHTVALGLTFFVMRHLLRARAALASRILSEVLSEAPSENLEVQKLARIERSTGLANAALLVAVGAYTVFDAIHSFAKPALEDFGVAFGVACVGLVVNVAGGLALHKSHDHNSVAERGMYLHIVSDALMSLLAIAALASGLFWGLSFADPVVGILGGLVILKWGASLLVQGLRK